MKKTILFVISMITILVICTADPDPEPGAEPEAKAEASALAQDKIINKQSVGGKLIGVGSVGAEKKKIRRRRGGVGKVPAAGGIGNRRIAKGDGGAGAARRCVCRQKRKLRKPRRRRLHRPHRPHRPHVTKRRTTTLVIETTTPQGIQTTTTQLVISTPAGGAITTTPSGVTNTGVGDVETTTAGSGTVESQITTTIASVTAAGGGIATAAGGGIATAGGGSTATAAGGGSATVTGVATATIVTTTTVAVATAAAINTNIPAAIRTDGTTANYCTICGGNPNIACNNNGQPTRACPADAQTVDMSPLIDLAVDQHNRERSLLASGGVPNYDAAARMTTVGWDAELSRLACFKALTCTADTSDCFTTDRFKTIGQNTFGIDSTAGFTDPSEVVTDGVSVWFGENAITTSSGINPFTNTFLNGREVAHFTLMSIDRVTSIGCCIVRFKPSPTDFRSNLVCLYNCNNIFGGNTYQSGPVTSRCTTGANPLYPALCNPNEQVSCL